jgi:hypothetical protein
MPNEEIIYTKSQNCKNFNNGYCKKKAHVISNGFAEKTHCSKCEKFILRKGMENNEKIKTYFRKSRVFYSI